MIWAYGLPESAFTICKNISCLSPLQDQRDFAKVVRVIIAGNSLSKSTQSKDNNKIVSQSICSLKIAMIQNRNPPVEILFTSFFFIRKPSFCLSLNFVNFS